MDGWMDGWMDGKSQTFPGHMLMPSIAVPVECGGSGRGLLEPWKIGVRATVEGRPLTCGREDAQRETRGSTYVFLH